jgi:hypothetical protein
MNGDGSQGKVFLKSEIRRAWGRSRRSSPGWPFINGLRSSGFFPSARKKHARRHSRIDSDRLDIGSRSPDRAALRKLGAASVTPPDVSYVSMWRSPSGRTAWLMQRIRKRTERKYSGARFRRETENLHPKRKSCGGELADRANDGFVAFRGLLLGLSYSSNLARDSTWRNWRRQEH